MSGRFLLLLYLMALAVRVGNVLLLSGDDTLFQFEDSSSYLRGRDLWLADGTLGGYLDGALVLPSERMPGYFWFLAGITALFGASIEAIVLVQGAVDAGTCVLIALLASRLSISAGRLAGISAALWPNLVIHASLVLQDTLFVFLTTAFLLAFSHFAARPAVRLALLAGLLFGAALLVRSVVQFLVFLVPLAMIALMLVRAERQRLLRGLAAALVFVAAAAVPISPVLWRNQTSFGTMALTTQTGLHAYLWTLPLVRADQNGTTLDAESALAGKRFSARMKARGIDPDSLDPFARDRLYQEMAMAELFEIPVSRLFKVWAQGMVINLFSPAVLSDGRVRALPRPSFSATGGKSLVERAERYFFANFGTFQAVILAGLLFTLIVTLVQLLGLWRMVRLSWLAALGAVLYIGYFLAISGPTAGPKYRMPFEPVMVVLMGLGIAWLFGRGSRQRRKAREEQAEEAAPEAAQ